MVYDIIYGFKNKFDNKKLTIAIPDVFTKMQMQDAQKEMVTGDNL